MDILSDYRISALLVREQELARAAERVRMARERSDRADEPAPSTGSLVTAPAPAH
jgi:hypothetical protein